MSPFAENRGYLRTLKRVVLRSLGGLAMLAVFAVGVFLAVRLAIHGREVVVPSLAGLSDQAAAEAARGLGLHLSVETRFYAAAVPVNHVLSQSPAAGSRVRRGWQIRVAESLGPQQVPVPDVTGQEQPAAAMMLRRLQLEGGTVAYIPGPGPAGVVLAQSPPPNVAGLDGPKVGLLLADAEDEPASVSYVMPSLAGMSFAAAQARLSVGGIRLGLPSVAVAETPEVVPDPSKAAADPAIAPTVAAAPAAAPMVHTSGVIVSQSPAAGRRVTRGDVVHVVLPN